MNSKAFTLIDFVFVIVVLGIICSSIFIEKPQPPTQQQDSSWIEQNSTAGWN